MDELKIVKLAELRIKMGAIPVKLLVAILLSFGMYCQFDFKKFMEKPVENTFFMIIMYGVVSYFWLCVRLTRNWLIGFIVAFGLIFLWTYNMNKLEGWLQTLIGCAICFGGVIMDLLYVIRYFLIKRKVFRMQIDYDEEEPQVDWEQSQAENRQQTQETSSGFFNGCKDAASIKRRYKDLCKVYHPDSGNGSAEIFNKITQEYDRLMAQQTSTTSADN